MNFRSWSMLAGNLLLRFSSAIIALFCISIMIYVASSYYKTHNARALFDNRENSRNFVIQLSQQLHNKAGLVIANNNFDPIMPNTLLKVLLRMADNEVKSYKYDKNLVIMMAGETRVIDVRDIIDYAHVSKDNNQYTIYLD